MQMETNMLENGEMVKSTGKGLKYIQVEPNMLENLEMVLFTDQELMQEYMKH